MDSKTLPVSAPFPTFGRIAERLSDNGYSPLPVKPGGKAVFEDGWTEYCAKPVDDFTLARWCRSFTDWGTGLATGRLVGIDIDILDAEKAYEAERRARSTFGDTPLVRIGLAPKRMLFYRTATPFPKITRHPLEVLGLRGQAVAFAIHPDTGLPYTWTDETPLDVPLSDLPAITEEQARQWIGEPAAETIPPATSSALALAEKGFRHDTLFPLVRRAALAVASEEALIQEASALNAATCFPPLPQGQVMAMARGVWRYREQGTLMVNDGRAKALLDVWEFDSLADVPEAIALLILLKLSHGAREGDFAIVPDAMADARLLGDWGKKSYMRARDVLLERGFIIRTHEGGGRGNPHLYQLTAIKGALRDHNIKETSPLCYSPILQRRSFVQVRYHLDCPLNLLSVLI